MRASRPDGCVGTDERGFHRPSSFQVTLDIAPLRPLPLTMPLGFPKFPGWSDLARNRKNREIGTSAERRTIH